MNDGEKKISEPKNSLAVACPGRDVRMWLRYLRHQNEHPGIQSSPDMDGRRRKNQTNTRKNEIEFHGWIGREQPRLTSIEDIVISCHRRSSLHADDGASLSRLEGAVDRLKTAADHRQGLPPGAPRPLRPRRGCPGAVPQPHRVHAARAWTERRLSGHAFHSAEPGWFRICLAAGGDKETLLGPAPLGSALRADQGRARARDR